MEKFYFDNSLLSTFAECKAKGVAEHKLHRIGAEEKIYADLGNVGHRVLELFFGGKKITYCLKVFEQEYDKVIPPGIIPDEPMFFKQNIHTILMHYMGMHPIDLLPFEVLELEENVVVEIAPGYFFSMKRDMMVKDKQSGALYPVDHKFRFGKITPWWFDKFKTNSQMSGYIWGTREHVKYNGLADEDSVADKIVLNIISLAALPSSNRKCPVHKKKYSECSSLHMESKFSPITRTPEQINAWKRDAIGLAKEAQMFFETFNEPNKLQYVPRTGAFSGGCTFCTFQKWCRTGFNQDLMETLTHDYQWRPWEELPF